MSLAAALLHSYGILTPEVIKLRILAATDFVLALRGKVFMEGKLNINKALLFHQDVVQLQDGQLVVGRIIKADKIKVPSEINSLKLHGEVYKIVTGYSNDAGKNVRVTILRNGKLMHIYA